MNTYFIASCHLQVFARLANLDSIRIRTVLNSWRGGGGGGMEGVSWSGGGDG